MGIFRKILLKKRAEKDIVDEARIERGKELIEHMSKDIDINSAKLVHKIVKARSTPFLLYNQMLKICDSHWDKMENECGLTNCCHEGCNFCCEQAIYVTPAEKVIILNKVYSLPGDLRDAVYIKATDNARLIEKAKIPVFVTEDIDFKKVNSEYLSLRLKCPCLDADGKCLIYAYRPTTCQRYRNYNVPSDCNGKISPYAISFDKYQIIQAVPEKMLEEGFRVKKEEKEELLSVLLARQVLDDTYYN